MSRRFKSRHGKVTADPHAKQVPPGELTDENSYIDPWQPDCRKPLVASGRVYVRAESDPTRAKAADSDKQTPA